MLFSPSPKSRRRLQLRISERRILLMLGDTISVVFAIFAGLYIWSDVAGAQFTTEFVLPQVYWVVILVPLWLLIAGANDFFDLSLASNVSISLQRLIVITLQMMVIYLLVFFISPVGELPRLFILYYGVISFVLIAIWRVMNPALLGWASVPRRILIVGMDEPAKTIIHAINLYGLKVYEIRGIIGIHGDVGKTIMGIPVIGVGEDLLNFVRRDQISELVITSIPDVTGETFRGVMQAYEYGVSVVPMPILYERITGRVPVQHVKNNWALVLPISGQSIFDPYPFLQRLTDVSLGLLGLVFMILIFPLLSLAIKIDTPGDIFYSQIRLGHNGRKFRIYKFRTMVQDAEKGSGAVFSQVGDPRVTRMGYFMRRTRLDELPQVINVLKGDMSVVGPRPERPEHVSRLTENIPFYRTRLVIRPGLTGWAQVRYDYGSNDVDALIKLEYDLYYIRNQNLLLDINIIIRTIGKVIRMGGL